MQINVGVTNQNQGQYAYTFSGINPDDVYKASDRLLKKLQGFKGFATLRSDYYNNTPNLTIDIDRDRASTYGVSTTAIENLLRTAYSQNYVYLIKKPEDQYQVILEVADTERAHPEDLAELYVRGNAPGGANTGSSSSTPSSGRAGSSSTNANTGGITTTTGTINNLVPLRAVTRTSQIVGPQAVNHLNQFTSVTINFNLLPGVAIGDAKNFHRQSVGRCARTIPECARHVSG